MGLEIWSNYSIRVRYPIITLE